MSGSSPYQAEILALARRASGAGRLTDAHGSARVDNPLCGDRVDIDIRMSDGRVEALGHVVKGCALCQASAAALAEIVPGLTPEAWSNLASEARAAIRQGAPSPVNWPAFAIFAPIAAIKARHDCVLLPIEATDRAFAVAVAAKSSSDERT